jgi:hypothetical protein
VAHYRLLNKEELEGLSKEFIEFLVLNGITADQWVDMKTDAPAYAEQVIEYFSEAIFEQIFRKAQFLRKITEKEIICYQCLHVRIVVIGIKLAENSNSNFLTDDFDAILNNSEEGDITIFHGKEKYEKKREHHMFKLVEQGFSISDGKYFKAISTGL